MPQPETRRVPPEAAEPPAEESRRNRVEAFAAAVHALEKAERRGDLASLRRLDVDAPDAPAFFRMVVKLVPNASVVELSRYAQFLQILALKPAALSAGSFGAAMAEAKVSEGRVQKLLSARRPAISEQVRLIARRLANAGKLPYRQIGDLLLVEDEDSEYADAVRLRIARDYWRALDRAEVGGAVSPET
jgi:CRISPR system Cascade subunit CasB